MRAYPHIKEQFSIITELIRNFQTTFIKDNELSSALNTKLLEHLFGINLYDLLTGFVALIGNSQRQRRDLTINWKGYASNRIHRSIIETYLLTSCKQESTNAKICLGMGIDSLGRIRFLANRLYKTYTTVWLKGCLCQIVPCLIDNWFVDSTVKQAMIHSPQHSIGKECRT